MIGLCLLVCAVLWASGITPSSIAVSQQGTWTVQPGNTPNIAAWLVTSTQSGSWIVQAVQSGAWNVGQSGAPWSQNLTELNSVGLGSPSAYGSSPGAVNVSGVNAFVTNTPAVSQSGAWTVSLPVSSTSATQSTASTNATNVKNAAETSSRFRLSTLPRQFTISGCTTRRPRLLAARRLDSLKRFRFRQRPARVVQADSCGLNSKGNRTARGFRSALRVVELQQITQMRQPGCT